MAYVNILLVLCVLGAASFTEAASASFITKCTASDANCIKESSSKTLPLFAAGLPDFGVEILDPMHFDKVDSSSPNLKFILTDVTLTGLNKCEVTKAERDVEKSTMSLQFMCTASLDGSYEMDGKILVLNMKGNGKVHVTLRDVEINVDLDTVNKNGADGKKHWHVKRLHHSFVLHGKSDVEFSNLFDGNEVLAKAAKELFDNTGNDAVHEIGAPMIKATVIRVMKNVNNFFAAVPADELALD